MPDDITKEGTAPIDTGGKDGQGPNGDDSKKQEMIPHQKFHEERRKRQEAEDRLQKIENERKAAEEEKSKEQGKYKELLEQKEREMKELQEKYELSSNSLKSFEELSQSRIEDGLQKLSEDDKPLVEKLLEGKSLAEKESLLPSLLEKFVGGGAANKDAQPPKADVKEKGVSDAKKITDEINSIKQNGGDPMRLIHLQAELDFINNQ